MRPSALSKGALALVTVLAVTAVSGCSKLESRKAEVHGEQRCKLLRPAKWVGREKERHRFYRYRARYGIGEPLPRSVSTRRGSSAKLSFVGRSAITKRHETGFSIRSVFMVVQLIFLGLLPIGIALTVLAFLKKDNLAARKKRMLRATIVAALIFAVSSYVSGSIVHVDNNSTSDLVVTINGTKHKLPKGRFMDVRVSGFSFSVETTQKGKSIEKLTLHPDAGFGDRLARFLWGNGRYIYNVCALNRYFSGHQVYKKR